MKKHDIENALNELLPIFCVYSSVDQTRLLKLLNSGKLDEAIGEIASSMGLPIKVEITHVSEINKGRTPAKVFIPSNLPNYGSPFMYNFPIKIHVCRTGIKTPVSLLAVLAHELAHIVLHSKRHNKKDDEYYTDLTAMLMGYAKIMKSGRKVIKSTTTTTGLINVTTTTHTNTITYGYLSDDNFYFAFNMIESYLKQQKSSNTLLMQKTIEHKRKLNKADKLYTLIDKYLVYLGNNPDIKVKPEDAQTIVAFHSPYYFDSYISTKEISNELTERIIAFCNSKKTYTAKDIESLRRYTKLLEGANKALSEQVNFLKSSIKILKKYVSFIHKLKLAYG